MSAARNVLSEIEWDEGLTMPVANAENKALETEVQTIQAKVISSQNELTENEERIASMLEHLKNVRQELQLTQGLVNARQHEADTEEHMLKVSEREKGRLKQEINRLKKEMDELKEKKNMFENQIFKQTQKLESLKSQMNWDQQALEAWLEESARKDEDNMTIQKYMRQDESKIKELSLRTEKLMKMATDKKYQLDNEMTNTLTTQIELDKIAEDFRKAHTEREELLSQWENTIKQMQRRDAEMEALATKLAKAKQEVRKLNEILKEKEQFLENEIENNHEQEKKISVAERSSAKFRSELQDAETQKTQFEDELGTLRRTVDRTALDLETTRTAVNLLKKEIQEKSFKLEDAKRMRLMLVEKLKVSVESALTAEERAARIEEELNMEEKNQNELHLELKLLGDVLFKKQNELAEAKREEKFVEASINGSHNAIKNLNSKISKLDTDALKQQEILYSQDFQLQHLERRIIRMHGEHNSEEKATLDLKVKNLSDEVETKTQTFTTLQLQLKRLQDDLRRVTRELEKTHAERDSLNIKIEELNLYNDNSEAEFRRLLKDKNNLMVDENLLKLETKKLKDVLTARSDETMTLEKRKLQLENAIKERKQEIKIHKEMLQAQLKATDEERQQISAELHERITKIDKLKIRFEMLMVSMAPPEGEDEMSQAYYVIKAAQEKEELQREGDNLDARIRKAEKEIRALENTLKLMNGRNEQYRKSFNKVAEGSDDMREKRQLDEQMRAVMDKYKYKRRQIRELQDDLHTMSSTLDNLFRDENVYVDMIEEKKQKLESINKDIDAQRTKIERVNKQTARISKDIRMSKMSKDELSEEKDFNIREMREFNKNVTKLIGEAVHSYPEMSESVSLFFQQANIPAPGIPSSAPSSYRSSVASSYRSQPEEGSTGRRSTASTL